MAKSDEDLFTLPSEARGGGPAIKDLEGELVVIEQTEDAVVIDTKIGESEAVPARVLVVGKSDEGWEDMLVFSAGVKAQLANARKAARPLIGVVGQGEAKAGKSAPWLITEPSAEQVEACRKAYVKHSAPF